MRVYEILYDTGRDGGPAADGTAIYRTRSRTDMERFCREHTLYGKPLKPEPPVSVSDRLARRWGLLAVALALALSLTGPGGGARAKAKAKAQAPTDHHRQGDAGRNLPGQVGQ